MSTSIFRYTDAKIPTLSLPIAPGPCASAACAAIEPRARDREEGDPLRALAWPGLPIAIAIDDASADHMRNMVAVKSSQTCREEEEKKETVE